ncbi:purine-nucleoside phosphorylase [Carnobacterium iners]|uniref:Purine nucleoside phosphorylase DeoD-type n=1 Tax=Carnobacterium iners TaxID=1073423 RepID=A0A1X7N098_9LACT|nr:purine-nucleoside phosphorylase [Carnobacterium iners]SEK18836.1 purine-nucleoside phosphorylase [Carnobacterium iners]SMH29762.1 purine-nucleoside phosphorylase [Carnobacterium iners]
MSFHISAAEGQIADIVLLPGDPLRAKYIAETFLEDAVCYNTVRNMLGYTGTYKGRKVSVQGTGMGMPSAVLYIHELINEYGVKTLIRVGTCGAIQEDVHIRDVIIAQAAATDSSLIYKDLAPIYFPPIGNYGLISSAFDLAIEKDMNVHVGNIFSSDTFYNDTKDTMNSMTNLDVFGVDMETAGLYYLASKFHVRALSILTVSDHLITGEETTAEERQTSFGEMIEVALEAGIK